jgi:L-lactate transport
MIRPRPVPWIQANTPLSGSVGLSAGVAAVPLLVIFLCLAVFRQKARTAAVLALLAALLVAVTAWGMPAGLAALAAAQGAAFGLFPVFFIVLASLLLYRVTVKGGQFEVIRASIAGLTPDRRIQALLIAFCFGAFIEGAAGFGAPVAIAGATLVGLGFAPLEAAGLCLVANTAPVAFGTIGIPIIAMAGATGLNDAGLLKLSAMVGRQLPFVSLVVPLYMVVIMVGFRRAMEILPAIAACGVTFAVAQCATANLLGPYLPDLLASLGAMGALLLLLRFWRPAVAHRFGHEEGVPAETHRYTRAQVIRAWVPYLLLTGLVLLWGQPWVKAMLNRATLMIPVPGLDGMIARVPSAGARAAPIAARFKFDSLASGGSAVLVAAVLSVLACGLGPRDALRILRDTLRDMASPAATIASILALAYVMNASGMTGCLGLFATRAGWFFPLISPVLGWIGVFLTGSDTSSNVLFGGLQRTAAEQLGINPLLTTAANTSGGVMGKMISPQSLAVACAATGMVGQEGSLFRFAIRHSLALLAVICAIVFLQAYYLVWMIPS